MCMTPLLWDHPLADVQQENQRVTGSCHISQPLSTQPMKSCWMMRPPFKKAGMPFGLSHIPRFEVEFRDHFFTLDIEAFPHLGHLFITLEVPNDSM
ncbi:MAG: hypothetical protein JWR15_2309 [Prosthecobacter sp.]|nr:hypothetical protein [Prosthecobacter sp.]